MLDKNQRVIILGKWAFKRIEMRDKEIYSNFIKDTQYPADLWSSNFDYLWAVSNPKRELVLWKVVSNMLVIFKLSRRNVLQIAFPPLGKGSAEKAARVLLKCMKFCDKWNQAIKGKTRVRVVTEQQLAFIKTSKLFERKFRYKKLSGVDRHISVEKMISLSGKEFKDLRNNINRFRKSCPNAIVRPAEAKDYPALLGLKETWNQSLGVKYKRIWDDQFYLQLMKFYQELDHIVLVAENEGQIIGVVSGGILPHGQAWGALLKKRPEYPGLSEFLNVEFAREIHKIDPSVELINLGTDSGNKGGLRTFKDKFRPTLNARRYSLHLRPR